MITDLAICYLLSSVIKLLLQWSPLPEVLLQPSASLTKIWRRFFVFCFFLNFFKFFFFWIVIFIYLSLLLFLIVCFSTLHFFYSLKVSIVLQLFAEVGMTPKEKLYPAPTGKVEPKVCKFHYSLILSVSSRFVIV